MSDLDLINSCARILWRTAVGPSGMAEAAAAAAAVPGAGPVGWAAAHLEGFMLGLAGFGPDAEAEMGGGDSDDDDDDGEM